MQSFTFSPLKKIAQLSVLALATSLAACGGGGGGSGSESRNAGNTATPNNPGANLPIQTVQGTVNKGVVRNGLVSVYAVNNGKRGQLLTTTSTNQHGQFSASFASHSIPVLIEVTAASGSAPTLMACDAGNGCGGFTSHFELDANGNGQINFGENFPVSSDFRLTTALPSTHLGTQTSISPLTHLAAQYAASLPQGLGDTSINVAMSLVQNLFALHGNLLDLKAVDITNPAAVVSASTSELRYALVSGAIMGLTDSTHFNATLSELTTAFLQNDGRLTNRSEDSTVIAYLDLVEQAQATADTLELEDFSVEFAALVNQLQSADADSLTGFQGTPSQDLAGLGKAKQFVADLAQWQDYLGLAPNQQPFMPVIETLGTSTGTDMATMLQALAIAGQYGPIVALPDLALDAACDSLGTLASIACRIMVGNKSLEQICQSAGSLTINGRSLCEVLNDLTLPLGKGLRGHFALYDGVVRIYGTLNGADVDLTFTRSNHSNNKYGFIVAGTMNTDSGALNIDSGKVTLAFEEALNVRNLKLPATAVGDIDVRYVQGPTDASAGMHFGGKLNLDMDLRALRNNGPAQMKLVAVGQFASAVHAFNGSIIIEGGTKSNVTAKLVADLPGFSGAELTLVAAPDQLANGQAGSLRLNWDGKQLDILGLADSLRINNQDGMFMHLDLDAEDASKAGSLLLNGAQFGTVDTSGADLLFHFTDSEEIDL